MAASQSPKSSSQKMQEVRDRAKEVASAAVKAAGDTIKEAPKKAKEKMKEVPKPLRKWSTELWAASSMSIVGLGMLGWWLMSTNSDVKDSDKEGKINSLAPQRT